MADPSKHVTDRNINLPMTCHFSQLSPGALLNLVTSLRWWDTKVQFGETPHTSSACGCLALQRTCSYITMYMYLKNKLLVNLHGLFRTPQFQCLSYLLSYAQVMIQYIRISHPLYIHPYRCSFDVHVLTLGSVVTHSIYKNLSSWECNNAEKRFC